MPMMNEINLKVNVTYGDSSLEDHHNAETSLVMFILWGIVLPLIATVGLVGNILTIIVLWRKEMHSTTILYLRGMVITDTGILIGSVITLTPISCANYLYAGSSSYIRDQMYPVLHTPGYYIIMTLQQCNVWITVSVSMERYIAICHPFRAARLITRRKTIIVMVVIVIVSLIYNIPHLFATTAAPCEPFLGPMPTPKLSEVTVVRDDGTVYEVMLSSSASPPYISITTSPAPKLSDPECLVLRDTAFGKTSFYLNYRSVMYSIIIYVIPFLALLILNSFLIKELMTMQRRRTGTNIHDENEANLSMVLVLIVIVFIFCQTPGLISQFEMMSPRIFICWLAASNVLFTTNSAVNFLIYTAFGRKFRRVLLRVFRHIFSKSRRASQSSYRMTQYTVTDYEPNNSRSTKCVPACAISCYKTDSQSGEKTAENVPLTTVSKESTIEPNGVVNVNNSSAKWNGNGPKKRSLSPTPEDHVEGDSKSCEQDMETMPLTSGAKDVVTYYNKDDTRTHVNSDLISKEDKRQSTHSDCSNGEPETLNIDTDCENEDTVVCPNPHTPSVYSNGTTVKVHTTNTNGKVV